MMSAALCRQSLPSEVHQRIDDGIHLGSVPANDFADPVRIIATATSPSTHQLPALQHALKLFEEYERWVPGDGANDSEQTLAAVVHTASEPAPHRCHRRFSLF